MNHTEHYQLSQWEYPDRILMSDFNSDNAKIDAAFVNHPSAELLWSRKMEETEEGIQTLSVDITQLDWSRYLALVLMLDTPTSNGLRVSMGSGSEYCVYLYDKDTSVTANSSLAYAPYATHLTVVFPVFYDGSHAPSALSFGSGLPRPSCYDYRGCLSGGGGKNPMNQCTSIHISRQEGQFLPGDRVVLWGIK